MSETGTATHETDNSTEAPKPTPPPSAPNVAEGTDPNRLPDDHPLVKTLASQKDEIKALKAKATRLDEIEDAQKTSEQRAAESLSAAEKRVADAEARADRRDVAIEHRLSTEDAALLDDLTDPDAMRRLAGRLAAAAESEAGPRTPRPNPAQREGESPVEDKDATARAFFGI